MTDAAAPPRKAPRATRALAALKDRRMAAMAALAFAAGLPRGAILGLLNAWLTENGVTPSEIGVLSLVMLGYAFKYLWAPLFLKPMPFPGLARIGARKSWLLALQIAMAGLVLVFAALDPASHLGLVALIALVIGLLSPTHDLILDAWRIEVARSEEDIDLMSALYQFGYKSAGFVTGFLALLLAEHLGWAVVFVVVAGALALSGAGTLIAPEPASSAAPDAPRPSYLPALDPNEARLAAALLAAGWTIALVMIAGFVIGALTGAEGASGARFVRGQGPWIVAMTVIMPALLASYLVIKRRPAVTEASNNRTTGALNRSLESLFRAVFDPLIELIDRLRWGAVLVLLLALTYRFTDAVWGSFAYPFYLGEDFGGLGHSLADVAIASKFFGVVATILGSLIGAAAIAFVGRMPVFFVGGVVAAATNLLYADLAAGAAFMDQLLAASGLGPPLVAMAEWASGLSAEVAGADHGQRMARLMLTIFLENLAGGLALVAITAFLTSVVSPRFAAVQYALLASLTMLIGTLGRPWLGEIIEAQGYYTVFIVTFWLGGVAVVLSVLEWIRQARSARRPERS